MKLEYLAIYLVADDLSCYKFSFKCISIEGIENFDKIPFVKLFKIK